MHTELKNLPSGYSNFIADRAAVVSSSSTPSPDHCEEKSVQDQLISAIIRSMDAEKIYLLNKYPSRTETFTEEYDLLIIVNDTGGQPMNRFESLLHDRSHAIAPVFASVYPVDRVNNAIATGNTFFVNACQPHQLVYDAGRRDIFKARSVPGTNVPYHSCFSINATQFLQGAIHYHDRQQYPLACFMLHQSVEQALSALLIPLMQFHLKTHNLSRLLRLARRFSMEVYNVFPRHTMQEDQLFRLLQKAYLQSRYMNSFTVTAAETTLLVERCTLLLQKVKEAYQQHLPHTTIAA